MHILHLNQRNQILFQFLRDKKKKRGGENSPISPPLDPRLDNEVLVHATFPVFCYQTSNSDAIARNNNAENEVFNYKGRVWSENII